MSTVPTLSLIATKRNPTLRSSEQTLEGARKVASINLSPINKTSDAHRSTDYESTSTGSRTRLSERNFVVTTSERTGKTTALSLQIMDGRLTDGGMPTHRPRTRYNIPPGPDLCVIGYKII
jgi:hypothetical protein